MEKKRVGEIQAGKGASKSGREFARKPFGVAADEFQEERRPHVAERTHILERNLLSPLRKFFGERPMLRITAEEIAAYQRGRRETGISGRTLNMEIGVLRRMMKRARVWAVVAEDVKMDRENAGTIGRVLTAEQKKTLFETAASKDEWMVVYCAAVLAVSTTCRGVELEHLCWGDVDLFESKPQKTWRTAWRSLIEEAARRSAEEAAKKAREAGGSVETAQKRAKAAFISDNGARLRFHDLRHQAITELAETGASDATMMALAGHMTREMVEHYSHVRMATKRAALDKLSAGLMKATPQQENPVARS